MKANRISELCINPETTLGDALRRMDDLKQKLLMVTENKLFKGLVSIGDIQRAIIKGIDLTSSVFRIMRSEIEYAMEYDSEETIKNNMLVGRSEYMPIISKDKKILDVIFWEDIFDSTSAFKKTSLKMPVVIMAGGIGSRLRPLTNVIPKALIPIGEKSIIEQIMDSFLDYDCREYYISVNHKSEMIKYYFENIMDRYGSIHFVEEISFRGTAGSINLVKDKINSTFFVSNCDILVEQDYADILEFHRNQGNEITVVAAVLNTSIPYGVLNTSKHGQLESMTEKPKYFHKINTGLYLLEPSVYGDIPAEGIFHITDLIGVLLAENRKVGVFLVSEKSWRDMGNWSEFLKQAKVKEQLK